MTNNSDDFENPDYNPTEELPPPKTGMKANLAEAWRSRPLFKLMVLMIAVAALVAAGVSFFSGGSQQVANSKLVTPPSINAPPGGPASPYMQQQTNLANQSREQQALQTGGSALPTPIGQATDVGALNSGDKKNDPLNELKAEIERLRTENRQTQQVQVQQQAQVQQQHVQQEQFDDSLATAMQRQMGQLTDSWTPHGVKAVLVANNDVMRQVTAKENQIGVSATTTTANGTTSVTTTDANGNTTTTAVQQPPPKALVQAGTVSYAQLLTEANSDVPGPILAQILSGPFAGARAVGQFQVSNGWADYLVLQFNLVNFKGKDYQVNAVALDPNTTLGGMATDVDQRYFTRVVLPAAAGFLQGFGSALGSGSSNITTNGTTTVVSQSGRGIDQGMFQGLGQGASTVSQFFQQQANTIKPLVRVQANTPIGFFFVTTVFDQPNQGGMVNGMPGSPGYQPNYGYTGGSPYGTSPYGAQQQSVPYLNYASNPYLTGSAYPGTTVNGYGGMMPGQTNSNVPYPNYANQNSNLNSPYSAWPQGSVQGLGTGYYGH